MKLFIMVAERGERTQTFALHCETEERARAKLLGGRTGWNITLCKELSPTEEKCFVLFDNQTNLERFDYNFDEIRKNLRVIA